MSTSNGDYISDQSVIYLVRHCFLKRYLVMYKVRGIGVHITLHTVAVAPTLTGLRSLQLSRLRCSISSTAATASLRM